MSNRIRFAGIPRNQERRATIQSLISCDHQELGGQTNGIDQVRMTGLIGEYLKQERAGKQQGRRQRKTCKNADHTQPCYCLNLKRFQDSQKEEAA